VFLLHCSVVVVVVFVFQKRKKNNFFSLFFVFDFHFTFPTHIYIYINTYIFNRNIPVKMIPSNVQHGVAEEVNSRLARATEELQAKYARGEGGKDVSVDGPSGTAYKERAVAEAKARKERKQQVMQDDDIVENPNTAALDAEEGDDEDNELRELREQRLRQIKASQMQKLENLGKGHGQYREITQDEFLAEVTSSTWVVCHFYHRDFARCEILDHHISRLVGRHVETKFIKINAEKAPFFVEKLKIRTIPSLIIFNDGVAVEKILGFQGLADGQPEGKEDEWPTIRLARLLGSKGAIDKKAIVDDDEVEVAQKHTLESMRAAMMSAALEDDDDFDD
jgi:hypothetical protein